MPYTHAVASHPPLLLRGAAMAPVRAGPLLWREGVSPKENLCFYFTNLTNT